MAEQNFVDYVKILFKSGKGGAGSVHFYRGPANPKGGPDGGDGGRGGHIILKADPQEWTLLSLRYTKHIYAEDGQGGRGGLKTGSDGGDVVVKVPLGTVARDAETGEVLLEITEPGEEKILFPGGRGGKGNNFFKTATHQTPRYAQPGEPCIEAWVILELKVLADVGLVGFPNAGKSTLLSVVSAAKPKIGDYPFTTLHPNLGVANVGEQTFVIADIPGLIEGAAEGAGLGTRFLGHVERCAALLHLVDGTQEDVGAAYRTVRAELAAYGGGIIDKPEIVALNKIDALDPETLAERRAALSAAAGKTVLALSGVSGAGVREALGRLWAEVARTRGEEVAAAAPELDVWRP